MTNQIPDTIYYEGRRRALMTTPLEAYFEQGARRPERDCSYSALCRGYIATWRLVDEQLFLTRLRPGTVNAPRLTLSTVFPGQGRRVFASWFTGRLHITEGRGLTPLGDFMNAYKHETLVEMTEGIAC